jgi:hypothetical protein
MEETEVNGDSLRIVLVLEEEPRKARNQIHGSAVLNDTNPPRKNETVP